MANDALSTSEKVKFWLSALAIVVVICAIFGVEIGLSLIGTLLSIAFAVFVFKNS